MVARLSQGCCQVVARLSPGWCQGVARVSPGCRQGDLFAPLRLLNCPCARQGWPTQSSAAPIESLDMSNSKYVSHSPIDEHLKRAEPRTVSFPPFRGIGPPTHLLGVGRGNLTRCLFTGIIFTWTLAFVVVETKSRHHPPTSVPLTKQLEENCKTSLASPNADWGWLVISGRLQ